MTKLKGFLVFLIMGAFLLPIGFGTSEAAAPGEGQVEWKTYSDDEYNWSINYPSSWWIIKPKPYATLFIGDGGVAAYISVMGEYLGEESPPSVDLGGRFNSLQVFLEAEARSRYPLLLKVDEGIIKVGGDPAKEAIYIVGNSLSRNMERRVILMAKDNVLYAMVYTAPASLYDELNEVYFEPMIQSMSFEKERGILEGLALMEATWADVPAYHGPSSDINYVPSAGMKFIWIQIKLHAGVKSVETLQVECYVVDQDGVRWNLGNDQNACLATYNHGLPTHVKNPLKILPGQTSVLYFEGQVGEKVILKNIGVDILGSL